MNAEILSGTYYKCLFRFRVVQGMPNEIYIDVGRRSIWFI